MGASFEEKAELVAQQLKGVTQVWFTQCKCERVEEEPIDWEMFKAAFLDCFFPLELREAKVMEFMNLSKVA